MRSRAAGHGCGFATPRKTEDTIKYSEVSIVIPNYNGAELLEQNLPSVLHAVRSWGGEAEIIVVDDCSSDESCRVLREKFPEVTLIVATHNQGFSATCNRGVNASRYPVVLCLNNDVRVEDGLIEPLLKHFDDDDVFAVTPEILAEREGRNQGVVVGLYGKGFLKGGFAKIGEKYGERENLYAIGACVAYDKSKFLALGGFAEIYTPYLFEDVDISYRAWKRGWKSIYEPVTRVFHYSSATIGRTKKSKKRTIYFRNRFLFHWINLTDPSFVISNMIHTVLRLAVSFLWLDFPYYVAFGGALRRLPAARELRREVVDNLKVRDKEILERTGNKSLSL